MDADHFDKLVRMLATQQSRRVVSVAVAGLCSGFLATFVPGKAVARRNRRKHRQPKRRRARDESKKGKKIVLCHAGQTVSVSRKKKKTHLRHGDTLGPCPSPPPSPPPPPPPGCTADCTGRSCGNDGCGGSCGDCASNETCQDGRCRCVPVCANRDCGDDGCGGSCGMCDAGKDCSANGRCNCLPDCDDRECGDDGCGGTCGGCGAGETCRDNACVCAPDCANRECGDDGCGESCGTCAADEICSAQGRCLCVPDCSDKECGGDGCGGTCGECTGGRTCQSGVCTLVCGNGLAKCGDTCVNLQTDWYNCGECGNTCPFDNGYGYCQEGTCVLTQCYAGWGNCDSDPRNGCETDLLTDVDHCGSCAIRCNTTNGTPTCVYGACGIICYEGFANCDGDRFANTGCEIDTRTDANNCGGCGQKCSFPNAIAACQDGTCILGACRDRGTTPAAVFDWASCDGDPSTGCETDIMNDSDHCGACNQACPDGQECFNGVCELPCGAGGPCRVFVTNAPIRGNMGGLSVADAHCQQQAELGHLPGTYMAWLSDSTHSPSTRFMLQSDGPYWTVDRVVIADDWTDLTDGAMTETISANQFGDRHGCFLYPVWTHTRPDGTAGGAQNSHCQNWSAGAGAGDTGSCGSATGTWTESAAMYCSLNGALYCFQQS